ncbi:MAG: CBS domain-containing protein, partial [Methanobacteriota archaeon]
KQVLIISISEMISLPKRPIREYMSTPLLTLRSDATLRDAIKLFIENHIHGAPIMADDVMQGILTLTDVAAAMANGYALDAPVTDVMTKDVVGAPAATKLFEVMKRFKEREIGRLIVLEDGKPIGILTQTDIIRILTPL